MENIDIRHVAKLAKLRLDPDKLETFEHQMQDILAMVDNLPALEGVLSPDPDNCMELRKDEVLPSLRRDAMLKNAPETAAGCVVVPQTVE